ncbi:MAG: hypothetical protein ACI81T_001157 [Bacteroidia bacterium]|jgi:hypothetical protein
MKKTILIFTQFLFAFSLFAQSPKDFEDWKSKFPEDLGIYLQLNRQVKIDLEGDSISIISEDYSDLLHLDERSKGLAKDQIYVSPFREILGVNAQTHIPKGNKYKPIQVTDFKEKSESSSGIFFDGGKSMSFLYPSVEPGVRTTLQERQKILDAHFFSPFYFSSFIPVISTKLEVTVHKDIELIFKLFNTEKVDFKFKETMVGDYKTYTWSAENLASYEVESGAPKASYYLPHIAYYVGKYTNKNGEKKSIMSDLSDLYGWYSELTCKVNLEEDKVLKSIVDGLVDGVNSEEEKVKKIFYWVQENIKYIAFEQGMRGFIPHDAGYVYEKRYGDCKDMASIVTDMLKIAGIKSHITWIGSRAIPYTYSELPTPMVDNHMIATYEKDGKVIFLDATSSDTYYGMPSAFIQGKEALLAIDKDTYKVVKVPVMAKEKNLIADTIHINLENSVLKGKGKLDLNGYTRVTNLYKFDGKKDDKQKALIKGFVQKGSNKFLVDDYEILNKEEKEKPLTIEYEFQVEDYAKTIGDEIYLNLTMEKPFFNQKIDKDRKLSLENNYHYIDRAVTVFELPTGYKIEELPKNSDFQHKDFGYSIVYKQNEGKITQTREIYKSYLILEPTEFEEWNKMIKQLGKSYRDALILKKS